MSKKRRFHGSFLVLVVFLAAALAGCGPGTPAAGQRSALESAQKDFASLSGAKGLAAAFSKYAADDAVLLPVGHDAVRGRGAIVAALKNGDTGRVRWSGEAVRVAGSNDVGGTWGEYVAGGGADSQRVGYGKFLAVWEKRGGRWRIAAFMANRSPGPGVK